MKWTSSLEKIITDGTLYKNSATRPCVCATLFALFIILLCILYVICWFSTTWSRDHKLQVMISLLFCFLWFCPRGAHKGTMCPVSILLVRMLLRGGHGLSSLSPGTLEKIGRPVSRPDSSFVYSTINWKVTLSCLVPLPLVVWGIPVWCLGK